MYATPRSLQPTTYVWVTYMTALLLLSTAVIAHIGHHTLQALRWGAGRGCGPDPLPAPAPKTYTIDCEQKP